MIEYPSDVTLVEMLPRDGFQRLDEFVPTDEKVEIIDTLSETGVDEIEITSFTHPKAVPTLRDADEVAARIERHDDVTYRALVPNAVGMERAIDAGVDKVNALVTVSETYSEHNQNMTVEEILEGIEEIVEMADGTGIEVEAGMGTSFYCPYEGRIPMEDTLSVVDRVVDAGVDEVTLATTMGLADPVEIEEIHGGLRSTPRPGCGVAPPRHERDESREHSCCDAVWCRPVRRVSLRAWRRCRLTRRARRCREHPTEDLVQMVSRMGLETNADFDRVESVAHEVSDRLDLGATSHVLMGGTVDRVLATVAEDNS